MNFKSIKILAILISVSALILVVYFLETQHAASLQENSDKTTQTKPSNNKTLEVITQFNRILFADVSDAVVVITSTGTKNNDPSGSGTGFFIDSEGHILTSIDNIDAKDESVEIMFKNGIKSTAKFVGSDELNSCALLKLTTHRENLKFLKFADSKKLNLTDTVFVLSNAFNDFMKTFTPTFSKGEVTGFYRSSKSSFYAINWVKKFNNAYRGSVIEMSCSVNEGSFGAPLLNCNGEVVGVISKSVDINRWLGTAIPAHQITATLENIKLNKKNVGAKINFTVEDISEGENKGCVKINKIDDNAHNNLKINDVIKIFDCDDLTSGKTQFDEILKTLPACSRVYFTIIREGKILKTVEFFD